MRMCRRGLSKTEGRCGHLEDYTRIPHERDNRRKLAYGNSQLNLDTDSVHCCRGRPRHRRLFQIFGSPSSLHTNGFTNAVGGICNIFLYSAIWRCFNISDNSGSLAFSNTMEFETRDIKDDGIPKIFLKHL